MTGEPSSGEGSTPGGERPLPERARGWGAASARGFLVLLLLAAAGQVLAIALRAAGLGPRSAGDVFKVGLLYVSWFHHAAVRTTLELAPGGITVLRGGVEAGLAFLAFTGLAAVMLFRAGRAFASNRGGSPSARALGGAMVAPAYAAGAFLVSVAGTMRFPTTSFGVVTVRPDRAQAFLFPLVLAAAAGGAGGLFSDRSALHGPAGRPLLRALAGGFRMFVLALALSFVALLALAALEPGSTRAYFDEVSKPAGAQTALILGHHVLLLPNQSMWVLVPAMGGCDEVRTPDRITRVACFGRAPRFTSALAAIGVTGPQGGPPIGRGGGRPPFRYLIFVLVPPLATFLGARAGARGAARSPAEGAAVGAAGGVVFALLVAMGSWASGATGTLVTGSGQAAGRFSAGPNPLVGGLLALAWGVVLGAAGGWFEGGRALARCVEEQQAQQV